MGLVGCSVRLGVQAASFSGRYKVWAMLSVLPHGGDSQKRHQGKNPL